MTSQAEPKKGDRVESLVRSPVAARSMWAPARRGIVVSPQVEGWCVWVVWDDDKKASYRTPIRELKVIPGEAIQKIIEDVERGDRGREWHTPIPSDD